MNVIHPITITDTIFTASNVPENDEQEWSAGNAYTIGAEVMVTTSTANVHKTYECLEAQSAGLTADILDEDCNVISDWTDDDTGVGGGVSSVNPAGTFLFYTYLSAAGNYQAARSRILATPPNTFSLEIKLYHDLIGTVAKADGFRVEYHSPTWRFQANFCSDGLFITKAGEAGTEVGTNIVKCNTSAAWQTWRFEVNKTTESTATVEVFLKEEGGSFVSQGTYDCDYEIAGTDGKVNLIQFGWTTDYLKTSVSYIKIGTGLGFFDYTNDSPVGNTKWLEVDSTNRWRAFNNVLGSQTEQATKIEYVLTPGESIDSVALLNLDSDTVDIVEIDGEDQLILNNDWTDATGGNPPKNWGEVGTVADFTIESAALKITADGNGEGISQTIAVSAATEYQLLGIYKNTSGDLCQINIYDVTHSADIVATYDLTSSTVKSSFSKVFTTPTGCTSIKISLLAKTAGDIVWYEAPYLCPTEYSETVTTGTKRNVVKMDIPEIATGILTVTINKSTTAKIGELIIGNSFSLGSGPLEGAKSGFTNFSNFEQDTWGNYQLVPKSYAKKMSCEMEIELTDIDAIYEFLCDNKDKMMLYVGSETYGALMIYGLCKEPDITWYSTYCVMALEIRGVI